MALAFVGAYLVKTGALSLPSTQPTAVDEPRLNPEPQTGYQITVGEVKPGSVVNIDSVGLAVEGYVAVYKDTTAENDQLIGQSELLKAGTHTNISVTLSSAVKDGDVVFIRLQDSNEKDIKTEADTKIEVMKSVGMMMSHYDNEY